jgi:hypothetical protein
MTFGYNPDSGTESKEKTPVGRNIHVSFGNNISVSVKQVNEVLAFYYV